MNNTITVMLVDDHEIVRSGVRGFLDTQPDLEVVAEAGSGMEAIKLAQEYVPDVILMDLMMPGMDGVEAIWRVRRVSPRSQVVVLTSFHDDAHVFPAIKAGALSYVLKDISPEDLAETVRAAAHGEAVLNPRVAARLVLEMRGEKTPGVNLFTELSEREQEVLKLVAEGLSNAEIADKLVLSEKTVKGHVSNILNKLHLVDRTQAAVFAWREGLMKSD
ncbi:MAG TPA: response regulator transcription factor [Anaerolineaceae bacterium]|nr:response regulator transcription factor [Anaerolineaceae bacterium]HPN54007.1 response regulator transcription factor [Anaerolineaceae bacterium]